jgi:hypothetical protein
MAFIYVACDWMANKEEPKQLGMNEGFRTAEQS